MSQPKWRLRANIGDVNPIDHGGKFVYVDSTGVYDPEMEILEPIDDGGSEHWEIHRFSLERCTFENGVLSDNQFHPDHAAWFADDIDRVKSCCDHETIIEDLCSGDPVARAFAYNSITVYFGAHEFDQYPLKFTSRSEIRKRYRYKY